MNTICEICESGVNAKTHITAIFASMRPALRPMLFSSLEFIYSVSAVKLFKPGGWLGTKSSFEEFFSVTGQDFSGTFVVVEGADASGKETQVGRLADWIRFENKSDIDREDEQDILERMPGKYPDPTMDKVEDSIMDGVWRLSFPTYGQTPGGRVVGSYLNGELGDRDDVSLKDIVDIYAADRKQFKELIREYLEKGGIVVCDRYREANLIHQLVDFEGREWEEKLEYIKSIDADLPDADVVFYLDISPETARERLTDKDKDIHEQDFEYMKKSNLNGQKLAKREEWTVIDGERGKEDVEADLREVIKKLL